jgi:hypothetical protein
MKDTFRRATRLEAQSLQSLLSLKNCDVKASKNPVGPGLTLPFMSHRSVALHGYWPTVLWNCSFSGLNWWPCTSQGGSLVRFDDRRVRYRIAFSWRTYSSFSKFFACWWCHLYLSCYHKRVLHWVLLGTVSGSLFSRGLQVWVLVYISPTRHGNA